MVREAIRTNIWVHFLHHYVRDKVVILKESNFPHPCCARCDMFLSFAAPNGCHPNTALCTKGGKRKRRRLAAEEAWVGT